MNDHPAELPLASRPGGASTGAPLLHEDVTSAILGAAFEVSHELGHGFLESIYETALEIALLDRGLQVERQHPIRVHFRGKDIGHFVGDMIVNKHVLVELKAVKALLPEHQAQGIHYLKATGIPVGLLINFGTPRIEYKRLTWANNHDMDKNR